MRISTKGRYALRTLIDLAEHPADGYISLKEISARQNISKKYLEQIIPVFHSAGIVSANRGPQGGYKLAKDPSAYTVGDILRLTEGPLTPVDCAIQNPVECPRSGECATLPMWQGLAKVINEYLDRYTLQDLIDSHLSRSTDNYVI